MPRLASPSVEARVQSYDTYQQRLDARMFAAGKILVVKISDDVSLKTTEEAIVTSQRMGKNE